MDNKIRKPVSGLMAVLTAAMFLIGCGGGDSDFYTNVRSGTEGLSMFFLENAPPDKVYSSKEGEEFQFGLKIFNKGAYEIKGGYIALTLENDYMELNDWNLKKKMKLGGGNEKIVFDLEGKSQRNIFGGQEIITSAGKTRPLQEEEETHTSSILVTGCYEYNTEASANVCIDPDVFNVDPADYVCTVSDVSLTNQGAPVAITGIGVEILPDTEDFARPQFTITVENRGNGNVIKKEKVEDACSSVSLSNDDWNTISVEEVRFSDYSLSEGEISCRPTELKLEAGTDSIKCTLNPKVLSTSNSAYSTPLYIKLGYGYTFTISKDIQISKVLP